MPIRAPDVKRCNDWNPGDSRSMLSAAALNARISQPIKQAQHDDTLLAQFHKLISMQRFEQTAHMVRSSLQDEEPDRVEDRWSALLERYRVPLELLRADSRVCQLSAALQIKGGACGLFGLSIAYHGICKLFNKAYIVIMNSGLHVAYRPLPWPHRCQPRNHRHNGRRTYSYAVEISTKANGPLMLVAPGHSEDVLFIKSKRFIKKQTRNVPWNFAGIRQLQEVPWPPRNPEHLN